MVKESAARIRILVVDDNADIRDFVCNSLLKPTGYEALVAVDGEEGVTVAVRERPDLILLDYQMPKKDGLQVLRDLQEQGVFIPVILITSHGSEAVAVDVFRMGVRDYVPKPFQVEELLQSIEKVLRMSRLEQEREALVEELKETNAQLAQRLKELDLLYHVGKSITMLGEPNRLLERILDAALYLTDAVDGVLVLMDTATGRPDSQVRRSLVEEGYVTPERPENFQTMTPGLMVSVSLQINGRVLGILTLSNKRSRNYFDQHDQRMIRMLADYATIALENFRLLAEVQAQQEREKRELRGLFERYVSPQVVEKIVSRPQDVRPGGQRQLVTVMFADLRGFTSFTARSSPEVLITVLNQHMSAAADVILKEEGTLDKFMGDEVMAFFNAPLVQADHALRAVRAGLRILDAARVVHDKLPLHNRLAFGVGISTGEAIVGNVGTPNLMNFTVVGSAVNKAHSLQELAPAGKVLICRQTYELVCAQVLAREMPLVQIKGQLEPEPVYEVVGIPTR